VAILERSVLRLHHGAWHDFVEHGKKWDAVAAKHGFPPATRYRYNYGTQPWGTVVWEARWDSLAQMEAKWASFWADPDSQPLGEQWDSIFESFHRELLFTIREFE
jgi:hypothetical protein